jgi:S1-C subfamily serine protease
VPSAAPSATAAGAEALQSAFVDVVNRVSPSVVVVETARGLGSGVVFDTKGDIVTNDHVVDGSSKFLVTLADGRKLDGTLVGTYPEGDLAVVHVTGADLQPATFGDSSKLAVGDIVLALGSPLGLQSSVTQGIISALGRSVPESASVTLPDVIQTSAEINPGNSGGALVDLAGDVVGIPTLAALDPQLGDTAAAGIGFAIPSNVVVDIAGQLIASGHVTMPAAPSTIPTTAS